MWEDLGRALCLMLVLEGIIPLLYPARWRQLVVSLAQVSNRQLRVVGLAGMLAGVGGRYLLNRLTPSSELVAYDLCGPLALAGWGGRNSARRGRVHRTTAPEPAGSLRYLGL